MAPVCVPHHPPERCTIPATQMEEEREHDHYGTVTMEEESEEEDYDHGSGAPPLVAGMSLADLEASLLAFAREDRQTAEAEQREAGGAISPRPVFPLPGPKDTGGSGAR